MCDFSSFTCETVLINILFLLFTGSLGELIDICKVLLSKKDSCMWVKFIVNNNAVNKMEILSQISLKF